MAIHMPHLQCGTGSTSQTNLISTYFKEKYINGKYRADKFTSL